MEKKIDLIMQNDKSISIIRNNQLIKSISANSRTINAKDIFDCFDYSNGDTYQICNSNELNIDNSVHEAIVKLFQEIANEINQIDS